MKYLFIMAGLITLQSTSKAQTVQISTDKTTTLVFPFPIRHVDRGTKDILLLPIKNADNILLVKAAAKNFQCTNLSVITADGSVYALPVHYAENPDSWIYQIPVQLQVPLSEYAKGIADNPLTLWGVRANHWNVEARVAGIYIKDNAIFYQLWIKNNSPLDYDIDFLRFYIKDKRRSKRTASQENEMQSLFIAGNTKKIKAFSKNSIVIALEKFTIPDAKYMTIEIKEKNGGRHLELKIQNNKIIKAIILPDLQ